MPFGQITAGRCAMKSTKTRKEAISHCDDTDTPLFLKRESSWTFQVANDKGGR